MIKRITVFSSKKVAGQITVISSLVFILIVSLILTCFKSVKYISNTTQIKEACMLSAESVFSSYNNDLLNEFNILLLRDSEKNDAKLKKYIEDNLMNSKDVKCLGAEWIDKFSATDMGGKYFQQEIISYMTYGVYSEILNNFKDSEGQVKKAKAINEITEDIIRCEDEMLEMDKLLLELIMVVDGIETNSTGIVIRNDKPTGINTTFVKSAIFGIPDMNMVNVKTDKVYNAAKSSFPGYVNIADCLFNMRDDVYGLKREGEQISEERGADSYAKLYERNYESLKQALKGSLDSTKKAISIIGKYETTKTSVEGSLKACKNKVDNNKEIIGPELYDGLVEDINDMQKSNQSAKKSMCDISRLEAGLKRNLIQLEVGASFLNELDVNLNPNNMEQVILSVVNCYNTLVGLSYEDIVFDYSSVDFTSESIGLDAIKRVRDLITDGILGLVVDPKSVSDKSINLNDLAINYIGSSSKTESDSNLNKIVDKGLFDEYLMTHFKNYTDANNDSSEDKLLLYDIEFIIGGEKSDKENLKQVVLEISCIREGMNMAYLLTDSAKKKEAMALATSLLGFTGNMAAIKAGQYLIMGVWAYAESICDIRKLLKGEKVEFVKTAGTWNMSLVNVLSMKFDNDTKEGKTGLKYADYLRMLLLVENEEKKNYRTMSVMELCMIAKGHKEFRMVNYLVGAKGKASFECKGRGDFYTQNIFYSYI